MTYTLAKIIAAIPWAIAAVLLGYAAAGIVIIALVLGSCIPRPIARGNDYKPKRKRKAS